MPKSPPHPRSETAPSVQEGSSYKVDRSTERIKKHHPRPGQPFKQPRRAGPPTPCTLPTKVGGVAPPHLQFTSYGFDLLESHLERVLGHLFHQWFEALGPPHTGAEALPHRAYRGNFGPTDRVPRARFQVKLAGGLRASEVGDGVVNSCGAST